MSRPREQREERVRGGTIPRFVLPEWEREFGVAAGLTGRGDPSHPVDLGLGGQAPVGPVLDRWRQLAAEAGTFGATAVARQVHGKAVAWHGAGAGAGLTILADRDGHATATPGRLLAVTVADCVPVYLLDPVRRAVALLHAGWRGTAAGILAEGVAALAEHAGSSPGDLVVHCGVGICGACYEVGAEVFAGCGAPVPPGGRGPLDLRSVLAGQAAELGVARVTVSPLCSAHDAAWFFSHRRAPGEGGRMAAYLGFPA